MKILFLIIGPVSFRAASFVRNFIKQLNTQDYSIKVMAENYTFAYLQATKNIEFKSMTDNFNEAAFQKFIEANPLDLIITVNFDLLLFDDTNLAFKKNFFSYIKTKTLFLVSNSNLAFQDGYGLLTRSPEAKLKINAPFFLLKSCPPYIADMDEDQKNGSVKTIYWKNLEQFAFLNKSEAKTRLKQKIKADEASKVVTLLLDMEQVFMASNEGMIFHYKILVECVYKYLANLEVPCNLIIGNLSHIEITQYSPHVKAFFFGTLGDEEHEEVIRSSDLILTESIANTSLIDSANIKIPVINLKNTLMLDKVTDEEKNPVLDEEGKEIFDIVFTFNELTDFAKDKVEDLIVNCPAAIFPYYAFPNMAKMNFDETKIFGHYIFTFSELFDEKGTTALIKDLLLNEEAIKEEAYRIEQYIALRADALDAQEILEII